MAVNAEHRDYSRLKDKWKRCRDCVSGEDAVHEAGDAYLPRLKDQTQEEYKAYVTRTPFYNATYRTISGMVGMIFRKEPRIEASETLLELFKDVTFSGVPLNVFAQSVVYDVMATGRVGILTDYPTLQPRADGARLTLLDAMQQQVRPTLQMYCAEAIINWKTRRVNNQTVLTMVVLKEENPVMKDEFEDSYEEIYRVLDLDEGGRYRQRLFRKKSTTQPTTTTNAPVALDAQGLPVSGDYEQFNEVYPLMSGIPLDYIPFVFIGVDNLEVDPDDPPFIDVVNLNLSHYRTSADYEHGAHFTGLPTPWITGYKKEKKDEKFYIGSMAAWVFPDPNVQVGYLSFGAEGLATLEKILERKERQLAVLGARMLEEQKAQVEAADTQEFRRKGEESLLAQIANTCSQGLQKALEWFAEWEGDMEEVICELNTDFGVMPTDINSLISAWQQGAISYDTLFENLQKGEIIPEDRTQDEEQQLIADQQAELAAQQAELMRQQGRNPDGSPMDGGDPSGGGDGSGADA